MRNKTDNINEMIPRNARLAIYGAGGRGHNLLELLRTERPDVIVRCFVDSRIDDVTTDPPTICVGALCRWKGELDMVVMASAYDREILMAYKAEIDAFSWCIFDDRGFFVPETCSQMLNGFMQLDASTAACWDQLNHGFEKEPATKNLVARLMMHTMVTYDGLMVLAELVRHCDKTGVPGAMVECGSWRGGSSALMAAVHKEGGEALRRLHVFDSFAGLPEPDGVNDMLPGTMLPDDERETSFSGKLRPIHSLEADRASNEEIIFGLADYPPELVTFHEGWFQDTMPRASEEIGPIALLRLDGDLYESYRVCLEHLYPLVVSGGIVIIDDWCLPGCRRAVEEYFERTGSRPLLHRIDSLSRYLVK